MISEFVWLFFNFLKLWKNAFNWKSDNLNPNKIRITISRTRSLKYNGQSTTRIAHNAHISRPTSASTTPKNENRKTTTVQLASARKFMANWHCKIIGPGKISNVCLVTIIIRKINLINSRQQFYNENNCHLQVQCL